MYFAFSYFPFSFEPFSCPHNYRTTALPFPSSLPSKRTDAGFLADILLSVRYSTGFFFLGGGGREVVRRGSLGERKKKEKRKGKGKELLFSYSEDVCIRIPVSYVMGG